MSRRARYAWCAVWLAFLGYPIGDIVSHDHSASWTALAWSSLLIFVVLYLLTTWSAVGTENWTRRWSSPTWLIIFVPFTFVLAGSFGVQWGGLIVYTGVATGLTLRPRHVFVTLIGIVVTTIAIGVAENVGFSNIAFDCFLTSALGITMLGVKRMFNLIGDLREAKDEIGQLTAEQERLRFSRDLHDVLGHNLSAVSLQAQLARRTMSVDPDTADAALAEVESIAQRSLGDMRELVTRYRPRTLSDELSVAGELLAAAGIEPNISRAPTVPELAADVLSWAVREGVTNVIRHSRATRCAIDLEATPDRIVLTISDDGVGPSGNTESGSGLRGLNERAGEIGGGISVGRATGAGFVLQVELPNRRP